jgi:hypothetical protein
VPASVDRPLDDNDVQRLHTALGKLLTTVGDRLPGAFEPTWGSVAAREIAVTENLQRSDGGPGSLAVVSLCADCRSRELFLLNQVRDDQLVLRSLEEHALEITYSGPE